MLEAPALGDNKYDYLTLPEGSEKVIKILDWKEIHILEYQFEINIWQWFKVIRSGLIKKSYVYSG